MGTEPVGTEPAGTEPVPKNTIKTAAKIRITFTILLYIMTVASSIYSQELVSCVRGELHACIHD